MKTSTISRRSFQGLLAGCSLLAGPVLAQAAWPSRPIRMVVPFPAGGPTDIMARVLGQAMSESLKTPFIIDNRGGAHGFVGASEAARAAPDGHTLMLASIGTMAINPGLHDKMPYDANRDFAAIALLVTVPIVVVVNPQKLPVRSVPELVAYLKAHPGQVNYGSAGNGGSTHLVPEYFKYRTGTFMTHIPYRGGGLATADLISGQVDVMFDSLLTSTPHIKSGKLRIIGTTTAQRLAEYPDVPTVAESLGMKDFEAVTWFGLYAPAGTPADIVSRLSQEVDLALKQPLVMNRVRELGAVAAGGGPQRLLAFQQSEQDKWGRVIRTAKIRPD